MRLPRLLTAAIVFSVSCPAQKHEIGLTLGGIDGTAQQTASGAVNLGAGTALQANYGYRFWHSDNLALFAEIHMLANPQRQVESTVGTATRDVASLCITPGLRLKFMPKRRVSPYLAAGGGYADFEQSLTTLGARPNDAPRNISRGVIDFGGGADFAVFKWLALRAEFRDFYSGSPGFNIPTPGGQHSLVAGGGFVLKLGSSED
jgi:opacity protein-like surface antigen